MHPDVSYDEACPIINASIDSLAYDVSHNFSYRREKVRRDVIEVKKVKFSPFETYIALLKAYCAISILIMPKAFANGGWAASSAF